MTPEPICWKTPRVIDAHTHYRGREPIAHYFGNLSLCGHAGGILLAADSIPQPTPNPAPYAFPFASEFGQPACAARFRVFGGLAHGAQQVARGDGRYLAPQVGALRAAGYDGIKMMEGSPYYKNELPYALDHEYFRPFWDAAEAAGMPITMHLANPADYWQRDDMAATHRDAEPQEEYFRQAEAVLAAHPRLRITFAHFMFMGPTLDRLARLFARYPQMRVDLAPGHEYLYYLSDDPVAARLFFIRWQDRILYGTDVSDSNSASLARAKAEQVRLFLETEGAFQSPYALALGKPGMAGSNGRVELQGLNLPVDVLERIMGGNVEAWLGKGVRNKESV